MGKYVYLFFVKWSEAGLGKSLDYWFNEWKPKHNELCEKHKLKFLQSGYPLGTVEDALLIYETDLPLAEYDLFKNAVITISEESLIAYTKTIIVNCPSERARRAFPTHDTL